MALDNVKILLGIDVLDTTQDTLLALLKLHAENRINAYIGEYTFPLELEWVADELTVKRYNKLNSEGFKNEGISGVTYTFEDDMLSEYYPVLEQYVLTVKRSSTAGKLVML